MYPPTEPRSFWRDVWSLRGAVTTAVLPRVLAFGLISAFVMLGRHHLHVLSLEVAPVELVGAVLALLMVLRTNAGYERWWEGRKLWGGIVNQSRNLAIAALSYGATAAPEWRQSIVRWTAAFAHVSRRSLRAERDLPEVARLVGLDAAAYVARTEHMPDTVAAEIARMLADAVDQGWLSPFAMLRCDKERALLIDHIGACERILKSPLPLVLVIKVRRFIGLYLLILPFSLVDRVGWATPVLTMLVAYPMLGLDQISVELENPFSPRNVGHLPLDAICKTIESNVLALAEPGAHPPRPSFTSETDEVRRPDEEILVPSHPAPTSG